MFLDRLNTWYHKVSRGQDFRAVQLGNYGSGSPLELELKCRPGCSFEAQPGLSRLPRGLPHLAVAGGLKSAVWTALRE